jgi:hypothetical protein
MKIIQAVVVAMAICSGAAQAQTGWGQLFNQATQAAKNAVTGQPAGQGQPAAAPTQTASGVICSHLVMATSFDCWDWPAGPIRLDAAVVPGQQNGPINSAPFRVGDHNLAIFADAVQLDPAGKIPVLHDEDTLLAAASPAYANARSFDRQDQAPAARQSAQGLVARYPLDADYVMPVEVKWFEYDMQKQQFPVQFWFTDRGFNYVSPDQPARTLAVLMMIPALYNPGNYPEVGSLRGEYDIQMPMAQAHAFQDAFRRVSLPNKGSEVWNFAMLHLKPVALKTLEQEPVSSKDHWNPAQLFVDYQITGITYCDPFGHPVDLTAPPAATPN